MARNVMLLLLEPANICLIIFFLLVLVIIILRDSTVLCTLNENMKKFLNKAKSAFDDRAGGQQQHQQQPLSRMQDGQSSIQPPTSADVTRYRYHNGTNLGAIFILEKWIANGMFCQEAKGTSELAAVEAWIKQEGIDKARDRHEKHWKEYVSDADLDWLRDVAKCTTVRLPIGYFTLGPAYCDHTPFKNVAPVYQNAWAAVKDLVRRCNEHGIGTLIDMHGLPGGANPGDHSGTDSGKAEFWGSRSNRDLATRALCFVAQQAKGMDGVAGIQIINEAEHNASGMYDWYDAVLAELGRIDPSMPVYISDAWDLNTAASWTQKKNVVGASSANPVVIDTHLYWCFSDADGQKSPQQVISEVQGALSELDGKEGSVIDRGAVQVVIGEYSCVLGDSSWSKGGGAPKEELVRHYGNAQSQRHQQRAGGSFFWTYRMDWMPGGEWGFKQMTEQHAITPPPALTLEASDVQNRISNAQAQQEQRKRDTVTGHCNYWDANHPGQYEHWRFEQGWDVGFHDAMTFFGTRSQQHQPGADRIGMLDLWILKRVRDSAQGGPLVWEFEQGLRQGVRDFHECVGV